MTRHAAVDVGSNSIRLLIAEVDCEGRVRRVHEDREVVRLGTGVFRDGRLSKSAMADAFDTLDRMADAIRSSRVASMRAVGTSALRDATNQSAFVRRATDILDVPFEVIDGLEEARLVQAGVLASWPLPAERTVIVDLGGGSAQLILGENGTLIEAVSLPLGAVRMTELFTRVDPSEPADVQRMRRHIHEQLRPTLDRWLPATFDRLVATSGTARSLISAVNGVDRSQRGDADRLSASAADISALAAAVVGTTAEERSQITGVGRRRAQVFVAGVTVIDEIVKGFGVPALHYSSAGLGDGIIADLAEVDDRDTRPASCELRAFA